jgi:1-acyl-sn-glycerol-3-phosphate acyltransferase/long-chain acyl-CoA synthetase
MTLRRAFERFARVVLRVYAPLDTTGLERLPAEPFLLCSNHASHMDVAALMVACGQSFDRFRLLAAADYFDPESAAGRATRSILNIVPVDRGAGRSVRLRSTIADCAELIRRERVNLIAFPEGTRSTSGALLPFKRGPAFLAVALDLPVVPAYIEGTHDALPKGRWLPRPRRIHVRFGPAIRPAEWWPVEGRAQADYVAGELERRIGELAGVSAPPAPAPA